MECGRVAQLVEQRPFKAWVAGSNPAALTIFDPCCSGFNRSFPLHSVQESDFASRLTRRYSQLPLSALLYNIFMARMVKCVKLGRELPGLDEPPFDTPLGQKIYENISAEAWRMWGEHSKMLLNEYRLQPWKPEAQQFLVEQMEAYFFGPGSSLPKEFVPPPQ